MGLAAALAHRQDFLIQRQGVVAGNIANASTPNYLAKDMTFKAMVNQASGSTLRPSATHAKHIGGQTSNTRNTGDVVEIKGGQTLNGNSVVVEEELLKMNDINLNYGLITQLFQSHVGFQKIAIGSPR